MTSRYKIHHAWSTHILKHYKKSPQLTTTLHPPHDTLKYLRILKLETHLVFGLSQRQQEHTACCHTQFQRPKLDASACVLKIKFSYIQDN